MKKRINWIVLIICFIVVYGVGFIGSLFTDTGDWYESVKPSISPPNYIFGIVWNVLFFLIALSLYFSFIGSFGLTRKKVGIIFGANLFLNIFWSFLFFGLKNPFFAFVEIWILLISIVFMMMVSYKISRTASFLLIPYLLWVGFAIVLNYLIVF
jgi:translocator protein